MPAITELPAAPAAAESSLMCGKRPTVAKAALDRVEQFYAIEGKARCGRSLRPEAVTKGCNGTNSSTNVRLTRQNYSCFNGLPLSSRFPQIKIVCQLIRGTLLPCPKATLTE